MALYIKDFYFPSDNRETGFLLGEKRTCFSSVYPFKLFPEKELRHLSFSSPITVLYGGNGSGKSTVLNLIAEKAHLTRHSKYNSSAFFPQYLDMCEINCMPRMPEQSQIITSDDVFDYLMNLRYLNDGIDLRREELFDEFLDRKYHSHKLASLADYDNWKDSVDAKTKTQSAFVRDRLIKNTDMGSNGESAIRFFLDRITENALYLLDEPENSLSVTYQLKLHEFLVSSARFFGCQFIIATHAPILLSMPGAKIYDLDAVPVREKKWTELENVRKYFDFFMRHKDSFE